MIEISLPDGKKHVLEDGASAYDVAANIGPRLAHPADAGGPARDSSDPPCGPGGSCPD